MYYVILTAFAIVLCIFLEWKWHINMGITACAAAFLIGCFGLGLSPNDIKTMLPVKIIFPITAITTFYGFAVENGTLQKLVNHMVWQFRRCPGAIPILLFALCILLGIAGMDAGSISIIVSPIAMSIVAQGRQSLLPCALATLLGSGVGSNYMFAAGGSIIRGFIEEGTFAEKALSISISIFVHYFICCGILIIAVMLIFRQKGKAAETAVPEPFDARQKINLFLITLFVLTAALPAIAGEITGSAMLKDLAKKLDVGFVAMVFALAATLLGLGNATSILSRRVPWKTLFMVSGITFLMGVAIEAGLIDFLTNTIGSSCPFWLVSPLLAITAGVMSFFSSAISVVIPTLFPMVPMLSATAGIAGLPLYLAITLGSGITAISPFSTGGSIMLGNCPDEKRREEMMFGQLISAFAMLFFVIFYCGITAFFLK